MYPVQLYDICVISIPASAKSKPFSVEEPPGVGILHCKGSVARREHIADFFSEAASSSSTSANTPSISNSILGQRKRSILKHESFDAFSVSSEVSGAGSHLRGVLKKDSSYDEGLKPILKNAEEQSKSSTAVAVATSTLPVPSSTSSASSSSSEDIAANRPFSDVIIDPIPGSSGRHFSEDFLEQQQHQQDQHHFALHPLSASATTHHSRKASLKADRQPVIPPSSVKISSDDPELADKLQRLAMEADTIRMKQDRERKEQQCRMEQQQRRQHEQQQQQVEQMQAKKGASDNAMGDKDIIKKHDTIR